MSLPRLLVLTDRAGTDLVATLTEAARGGARAVVLREKDLSRAERTAIAQKVVALLHDVDGTLIVASDPAVAEGAGTRWLHLAAADPVPPPGFSWGRSCHDEREVTQAVAEGASYVTVSPVFPTASKPGYGPALGVDRLRALVESTALPVYALGGIDAARARVCREVGAYGVAVMGEVMRSPDPASTVEGLLG